MIKRKMTHTMGLKILFGPKYWLWKFDEEKLSHITPYILSRQMSKFASYLYSHIYQLKMEDSPLFLWDMFGGIGTDSINLSQYFNIVTTENDKEIFGFLEENIKSFKLDNINLIHDNCLRGLKRISPDIIYFDPPWGDSWRNKIKNFDFNHVYIDYPPVLNDPIPELPKRISCVDLLKYLYQNVTQNIIIILYLIYWIAIM